MPDATDPLKVDPSSIVRVASQEIQADGRVLVNLVAPVPFDSPIFDDAVRAFAVSAAMICGWGEGEAQIIGDRVVEYLRTDRAAWAAIIDNHPRRSAKMDDDIPF